MTYEVWVLFFEGMVTAMLLFNVVQWALYGERIYGLYTLYMLSWLCYFILRNVGVEEKFSANVYHFIRITGPMMAYLVYYEFVSSFLNLSRRLPGLQRLFRWTQIGLVTYIVLEVWLCLLSDHWKQAFHEHIHSAVRVTLAVIAIYIVLTLYRLKDIGVRYLMAGSALLVLFGLVAMVLTIVQPVSNDPLLFWQAPLSYLEIGIVLELLFFSLALTYRQRQVAVRKLLAEQALARERERRQREHLETALTMQQLRQEMSEVQMRALQTQLNPHFLFNSLNSLSSLISDEPQRAEQFVDEMSSVYRYLLQNNEQELTSLATELGFIQSYFHLLKTRYGQGIDMEVSIEESYMPYQLPPLTLQLLVENAVKHNVVSSMQPLTIELFIGPDDSLIIRNNLQRKPKDRVTSTKKGLLNIITKYELLRQPAVVIRETADVFEIRVPLINPAVPVSHS